MNNLSNNNKVHGANTNKNMSGNKVGVGDLSNRSGTVLMVNYIPSQYNEYNLYALKSPWKSYCLSIFADLDALVWFLKR